jgi:hypothetical protein
LNRARQLRRANRSAFGYDQDIRQGRHRAAVHPNMDPRQFKNGIRESRDSHEHPDSNSIAVLFDVTGSMGEVPRILQKSLCSLMGLCLRRGFIEDPAILIGGIGDAKCDLAPLQIGQFEAGNEIEKDLNNLFLEGGGGGQQTESYELALYFLARKASMDCLEKRGKKGYAFIIGDELPYRKVSRREVKQTFGDRLQADIPIEQIVREAQEKFELYFVLPNLTSYYDDPRVIGCWRSLLGQNAIRLPDPSGISELIASAVGLAEEAIGWDELSDNLRGEGANKQVVQSIATALSGHEA